MIKKIFFIGCIVFILLLAGFFIWQWIAYTRDPDPDKTFLLPRVEVSLVDVTSVTEKKTEMNASVQIKNQLPFTFTADSFQYRIFINDKAVLQSRYKKSLKLYRNGSSWITLPVLIFNQRIDSLVKANELRAIDSAEYRLEASFFTNLIFKRRFTVNVKRVLPLLHFPEIKMDRMQVDSLNLSRASIRIHLSIGNKNAFPVDARDIGYELALEDNDWIRGTIPGSIHIREKGRTELSIPFRISFKEVSKTIVDVLKKGLDVNYKLRLSFRVSSDINSINNSRVSLENSGSVKAALKTLKDLQAQ